MASYLKRDGELSSKWLRILIIILLVIGIWFRFFNIDRKVYSYDEAITSLRISGYTWTEMVKQDFNGEVITVDNLQKKYQHINPDKKVIDTIKGLAKEEAQLTPLYFIIARFWVQVFGPEVAVVRSLSALISLLVFPCVYWLCLELFESSLVGWIAIGLMAVSPFQVLYAQEARPYILWAVIILLSSAVLLRSIRLEKKFINERICLYNWGFYATTVALGLYSHLLFGLVAIAHGIYVVVTEGFRFSKTIKAYLLASIASWLAFAPWIFVIITNSREVDDTVGLPQVSQSILSSFLELIFLANRVFLDAHWAGGILDLGTRNLVTDFIRFFLVLMLLLIMVISIYFTCKNTAKKVWLFLLILIGFSSIALILAGIVKPRYLVPFYLVITVFVSYPIACKINNSFARKPTKYNNLDRRIWKVATIALFSCGILSCLMSSQSQIWWNKYPSSTKYNPAVARIINAADRPLVITDGYFDKTGHILSLSYLLEPTVKLQLFLRIGKVTQLPESLQIPDSVSDVFLYRPTDYLLEQLENRYKYKIDAISEINENWLWRLKN